MIDSCFFEFKSDISHIQLPCSFTYPFAYVPHEITKIALCEAQEFIRNYTLWQHDFHIHSAELGTHGKMFGVLVVKNSRGKLGYLIAFSGKIDDASVHQGFVPPIANILAADSFFKKGEQELETLTDAIYAIERSQEYADAKVALQLATEQSSMQLEAIATQATRNKNRRADIRKTLAKDDNAAEILRQLAQESSHEHYQRKQAIRSIQAYVDTHSRLVNQFEDSIQKLKDTRKKLSADLQNQIFEQYAFRNALGETKHAPDIFADYNAGIPPAGTGDCAAPKLLQHVYLHSYTPIAMAEFWWGQTPHSNMRTHAGVYPSCKSKCLPLLQFMLQGVVVDKNPVEVRAQQVHSPTVLYEDAHILCINKPAEMLSVPGKIEAESVLSYYEKKLQIPLFVVHRLDMSTSGILIVTKNSTAYTNLQQQFAACKVQKRYVAIVQGKVAEQQGKISLPLYADYEHRPMQCVDFENGKQSTTYWKLIEYTKENSRIMLIPITGRTHQLRVHCAHALGLQHPIVGDELYGTPGGRLLLHAEYIEFTHPHTLKTIKLHAPADF